MRDAFYFIFIAQPEFQAGITDFNDNCRETVPGISGDHLQS